MSADSGDDDRREQTVTSGSSDAGETTERVRRRTYLTLVGATALGTSAAAGETTAQSTESSPGCGPEPTAELQRARERLAARRAELKTVEADVQQLLDEIASVRAEKRRERVERPEPIRERARAVGVEARAHLVSVEVGRASLLGWCFDERSVLTHTLVLDHRETEPGTEAEARRPDGETVRCELVDRTDAKPPGLALWRTDRDVPAAPHGDASLLEPGDELVGVTDVPDRERVITLGEVRRRVDESPASLASTVPAYGAHGGVVLNLRGEVVGTIYGSGPRLLSDLPDYLDGPVQTEALPWLAEYRHVPIETVRETVEGWT